MESKFNIGEFYFYGNSTQRVRVIGVEEHEVGYLSVLSRKVEDVAMVILSKGRQQISEELTPIPLCEAEFIGLGFQKVTDEHDTSPEYEIVLHGVIKIRFMYTLRAEGPSYYLVNPCMGPLFFEYVHEVQRILQVFETVKKTSEIVK